VRVATYAIGDIQGCHAPLQRLLTRIGFDPKKDRLWLTGDLVNRGPDSLAVLRWAYALGPAAIVVLGNHDLHLLARWAGVAGARRRDTLDAVLAAPDAPELLAWLRRQRLAHREGEWCLVHGGLLPQWTIGDAERMAREAEAVLCGPAGNELLAALPRPHGECPDAVARCLPFVAAMTRLRTCTLGGQPCDHFNGAPDAAPPGCIPWFDVPGRKSADATVVFGHWSALGLYIAPGLIGTDTGCVWGRELTAVRLDDRAVFAEPAFPLSIP